jgi:hypothetical protein
VSELQPEYEGQIDFTVIQTAGQEEASGVEQYDVGNHGLVVFDEQGVVVHTIPGHAFGKDELLEVCADLVPGE